VEKKRLKELIQDRGSTEMMFDGLKNIVDIDSPYMQNPEALQGWIFINHIAILWYYKLYMLMKNTAMLKLNSISDIIMKLKDVKNSGSMVNGSRNRPMIGRCPC